MRSCPPVTIFTVAGERDIGKKIAREMSWTGYELQFMEAFYSRVDTFLVDKSQKDIQTTKSQKPLLLWFRVKFIFYRKQTHLKI